MSRCFFSWLCKDKHEEKNLYSKMIKYVHDHSVFFDFNSKNGRDILWFPLQVPFNLELPKEKLTDLRIIDLTFPEDNQESDNIMKFIKAWPLVASCYIVMDNEQINRDAKFREEYIIPQMLTAYLKHNTNYKGICYYSTRNEYLDSNGKGNNDFRNVVLFTNTLESDNYDKKLMDMFHWYEPFNVGEIIHENK